ncbi:MAG: serine--tRNA ligase, partial [Erysipelotrichaceae bacterium]|nr:serine--tRNA ligase [Erysipelotrichaceae bacterium]
MALDAENRAAMQEADQLRGNRNKLSKQIGGLMAKGQKEEAEKIKAQVSEQGARLAE